MEFFVGSTKRTLLIVLPVARGKEREGEDRGTTSPLLWYLCASGSPWPDRASHPDYVVPWTIHQNWRENQRQIPLRIPLPPTSGEQGAYADEK